MALSKSSNNSTISKETVESLIEPVEEFDMDVLSESRNHIIDRLTLLYKNPKEATVRETISNAIDASVRVPNAKPIQVEFDSIQGTFITRDFGVGMDYDSLTKYCRYYGASDKGDDMTQIGSHGLGIKAPLSYTTEFSIRSIKDGLANLVILSNTSAGYKLKVVYKNRPTNDSTGTEVSIPVKEDDTSEFLKLVKKYQKYSLDLEIVINGEDSFEASKDWITIGEILLDEDEKTGEKTYGRVFMNSELNISRLNPALWLGGWVYSQGSQYRNYYYNDEPNILFELKPGVVNFSSSRDEVTHDNRSEELNRKIHDYINGPEFKFDCLKAVDSMNTSLEKRALKAMNMCVSYFGRVAQSGTVHSVLKFDESYKEKIESLSIYNTIRNLVDSKGVREAIVARRRHNSPNNNSDKVNYEYSDTCNIEKCSPKEFEKNFDAHEPKDFYSSVVHENITRSGESSDFDNVFFVTGASSETIKGWHEHRRGFLASRGDKRKSIFIILEEGFEVPKLISTKGVLFDCEIEFISMLDLLAEARKYKRENKKSRGSNSVSADSGLIKGWLSPKDSIGIKAFKKTYSLNEIDSVIVYRSSDCKIEHAANGADNSEKIDVESDCVLFVDYNDFKTSHLQELESKGKKCVFTTMPPRGVYLTEYAKKNLVKPEANMRRAISKLIENDPENLFKLIMTYYFSSYKRSLELNELEALFPTEMGKMKASTPDLNFRKLYYSGEIDYTLYHMLTNDNFRGLKDTLKSSKAPKKTKDLLNKAMFLVHNNFSIESLNVQDEELKRSMRAVYIDRVKSISA